MPLTNPLVKLKRGTYTALSNTPSIDGTMYLVEFNDIPELDASTAAIDNARRHIFSVDVTADDGVTVNRHKLDAYRAFYANRSGVATSAEYWVSPINVSISDSDGTNTGNGSVLQGTSDVNLKLPANIKANITGDITGNAATASALSLTKAVGSSSIPVYFNANGEPVACTGPLNLSINGNAQTADKWSTARHFKISDASKAHSSATNTLVDGTYTTGQQAYELLLPSTITATIIGKATSATKLVDNSTNNGLTTSAPASGGYYPVRFDNGVPVAITGTLANNISGTAASATVAAGLADAAGDTSHPVFINGTGAPTQITQLDVALLGNQVIPLKNIPKTAQERLWVTSREANDNAATDLLAVNAFIAAQNTGHSGDDLVVSAGDVVEITDAVGGMGSKLYYVYDNNGTLEGHAFSAGSASSATTAGTADALSHNVQWQIKDASGTNGGDTSAGTTLSNSNTIVLKLPSTIAANLTGNASTASALNVSAAIGDSTHPVYIQANGVPAKCSDTLANNISGNAATASQLLDTININGTAFNGSTSITTANWGTARTITIADNDNSHTQANANINGSANFTLKLPATIKATLQGNATTATTANATKETLIITYGTSENTSAATSLLSFNGSQAVSADITPDLLFPVYRQTESLSASLAAGTWKNISTPANMTSGTYIVQIATNNKTFNNEYFSGVMSYYSGTTTGADSDEVLLHSAGADLKGHRIYLRLTRAANGNMVIRYCADVNLVSGDVLNFAFRRVL